MKLFARYRPSAIALAAIRVYYKAVIFRPCKGVVKSGHGNVLCHWMKKRPDVEDE